MEGYIQNGFFVSSECRKITRRHGRIQGISVMAYGIVVLAGAVKFYTMLVGAILMTVEVE